MMVQGNHGDVRRNVALPLQLPSSFHPLPAHKAKAAPLGTSRAQPKLLSCLEWLCLKVCSAVLYWFNMTFRYPEN